MKMEEVVTPELEARRKAWAKRMIESKRVVMVGQPPNGWGLWSSDPDDPFPMGKFRLVVDGEGS